jgi:hypothetical protein
VRLGRWPPPTPHNPQHTHPQQSIACSSIEHLSEGTKNAPWRWQCNAETCRSYHTQLINWMINWCICWLFMHIFTVRRIYKSFGIKGLNVSHLFHFSTQLLNTVLYLCHLGTSLKSHHGRNWVHTFTTIHIQQFWLPHYYGTGVFKLTRLSNMKKVFHFTPVLHVLSRQV